MKEQQQSKITFGELIPREQVLASLRRTPGLYEEFTLLSPKLQEEFLNFCTGASGLMMCYDPFFKYIFDPDLHPERLSDLLTAILKQKVAVKKVLPVESKRIMAESSLLIMDIVVELADGSLANVEIQKIAHAFPGSRGACYSSDLVLRQYSSIRKRNKKKFSYKDLKNVYTIVILENSTSEFHKFPDQYIHHSRQVFDTGLPLNLIQEYVFIPLDVFCNIVHNEGIRNELEAWLAFLAFDDPKTIWEIRSAYPKFDPLYQDMAEFRKDIREVLHMFSKELEIMDKNNVDYMIDELQKQVKESRKIAAEARKDARREAAEARKNAAEARKNAVEARKKDAEARKNAAEARKNAAEAKKKEKEVERLKKDLEETKKELEKAKMQN